MSRHKLRIAIIGGGIGGLTLAIALRQRDVTAQAFEQSAQPSEIGAAVALSGNTTRELRRLGVLDAISRLATQSTELVWRNWRDGRLWLIRWAATLRIRSNGVDPYDYRARSYRELCMPQGANGGTCSHASIR
jgi:2-polyprenyl-6-methoxyphenol hydroxylase-like FAD-dependent oxidoreductase